MYNMSHEEAEAILCQMSNMSILFDKYTLLLPGFIEFETKNCLGLSALLNMDELKISWH